MLSAMHCSWVTQKQTWNRQWRAEDIPCSHRLDHYTVHCSCCKPLGKNWYLIVIFTSQVSPARFFAPEPWLRGSASTSTPREIRNSSFRFCTVTEYTHLFRESGQSSGPGLLFNYLTNPLISSLPLFLQLFHYFNNKFIEWAWFTFIIRVNYFLKKI